MRIAAMLIERVASDAVEEDGGRTNVAISIYIPMRAARDKGLARLGTLEAKV